MQAVAGGGGGRRRRDVHAHARARARRYRAPEQQADAEDEVAHLYWREAGVGPSEQPRAGGLGVSPGEHAGKPAHEEIEER